MFESELILNELKQKNWSRYKLSEEAKLAQSTIHSLIFAENSNPKILTLLKIINVLEMPIDCFFKRDKTSTLYGIEKELIEKYTRLNENEIKKLSGERIKFALKKRRWSVYKLAKTIGVTVNTLGDIIRGKNLNPRVNTLFKISEALEFPLEFFFIKIIIEKEISIEENTQHKDEYIDIVNEKKQPLVINILESGLRKMNNDEQEKALSLLKVVFGDGYFLK